MGPYQGHGRSWQGSRPPAASTSRSSAGPAADRRQICHPRTKARTRKKGTLTMSDRLAAHWPPTIRNLPSETSTVLVMDVNPGITGVYAQPGFHRAMTQ
jgi:hypothetical protein